MLMPAPPGGRRVSASRTPDRLRGHGSGLCSRTRTAHPDQTTVPEAERSTPDWKSRAPRPETLGSQVTDYRARHLGIQLEAKQAQRGVGVTLRLRPYLTAAQLNELCMPPGRPAILDPRLNVRPLRPLLHCFLGGAKVTTTGDRDPAHLKLRWILLRYDGYPPNQDDPVVNDVNRFKNFPDHAGRGARLPSLAG